MAYYEAYVKEKIKTWVYNSYLVIPIIVGVLQIVSGFILIWSVLKIRSFMNARFADGYGGRMINLKTLLLHSSTFFLFAVSVLVNTIFNLHFQIAGMRAQNDPSEKNLEK